MHDSLPTRAAAAATNGSITSLVDAAVYRDGHRVACPQTLSDTFQNLRGAPDGTAWIGLLKPGPAELGALAAEFELHELAVEDAVTAHQRPKLERYGDTLFVVLRPARYIDEAVSVEFGELHLFMGDDFVLTVRHSESPDLSAVRRRLESDPDLLRMGPEAVLYAILDAVVDAYEPVVRGLAHDIDEIETEVFGGDPEVSRRIYELTREVIDFQRAATPLPSMLEGLAAGFQKYHVDVELQRLLRDVADHVSAVVEKLDGYRALLRDILTVNATLVAQRQNEEMRALSAVSVDQNEEVKRVSAWAAILFAPTLVGTVYGMNFEHMPELEWQLGYPFALGLMGAVCVTLFVMFRKRGWL
jgi:magnesium transporter